MRIHVDEANHDTIDEETRTLFDKLNELLGVGEVIRRGVQAYARELGFAVIPKLRQVGAAAKRKRKLSRKRRTARPRCVNTSTAPDPKDALTVPLG